jgi:phosphoglycolate phosphatase-like HAD superfamily hydrolase
MVGDSESDVLFGKNLGCKTVYITTCSGSVGASYSTNQLILAANWIIRDDRNGK